MPGTLVDVGGYRVHVDCTGRGSPAVIIASGGFSVDWGLVQPQVAEFTRVCTYDSAGMAWSDEPKNDAKLSCPERVHELHSLLRNIALEGPYVLVGYSIGGLVTRLYASQYPAEVAGMVLVDHAFVDFGNSCHDATRNAGKEDISSRPCQLATVPQGSSPTRPAPASTPSGDSPPVLIFQTPIALDMQDDQNFAKLPPKNQEAHRWALARSSARPTGEMATEYFIAVKAAEGSRPYPLGNKPITVVSTLNNSPNYTELQHKLLALSRNNRQLIAENSTHMVNVDQPEIVVQAIREVVNAVRDGNTTRAR